MPLISDSIPSLVNGVSQQAYPQRLSSQGEAQENLLSSLVGGLTKRPGSRHLARLASADWATAAIHVINRDAAERYVVAITDGDLKVFDLSGAEQSVAFPDGKGYLAAADASQAFRAVTVADFSFVVNRTTQVQLDAAIGAERPKEALVHVRQGNYGRTYTIAIDGVQHAAYTTPDGGAAAHANSIGTDTIAAELETQLLAAGLTGFTIERFENAIHIQKAAGDFSIAIGDGYNGDAMKVAKDQLQRFSDLPNYGPDGFHVEIVGDPTSNFDNYYVAFEKASSADGAGVWREVRAQGGQNALDAATMPHLLVREPDGSFTFKRGEWKAREVGDADSAPAPSFVGRAINDVFFFRNRFGLLADESVILSRAGGFFNFWPKTVTALVDSDPIDVAGSHSRVSILRHAVPFNRSLLLFADQTQFVMEGDALLTPTTASLRVATEFVASLDAKPVSAGRTVYFAVEKGGYAGLREYYVDGVSQLTDAAEVTKHTPTFIPEGVSALAASKNDDILVALSRGARDRIFVYSYYWSRDDKLQSSWSIWRFEATDSVLAAEFVDQKLIIVVARADGVFLEELDLEPGAREADGLDWALHLDRRVDEADCVIAYEPDAGRTRVTLPFAEDAALWVVGRAGQPVDGPAVGGAINHVKASSDAVLIDGDHTASKLAIGRRFLSRYVFSPFVLREGAGGGETALGEGRLQILYLSLFYQSSGPFRVIVKPKARAPYRYDFTGRVTGAAQNRVGAVSLETGRFKLPVYAENDAVEIALESDSYLPIAISSAEWEGRFTLRSRRM